MTFHSKAATDEVYHMFNQPSRKETARGESDDDDDDDSTAGESIGTGRISGTTSEFGDDDTLASGTGDEYTRTGSQPDSVSPWSDFTASKHVPNSGGGPGRSNASEEATENLSSSQNQTQTSQISVFDTQAIAAIAGQQISDLNTQVIAAMAGDFGEDDEAELKTALSPAHPQVIEVPNTPRFVPLPPEDYEPTPLRPYRDAAEIAQHRLPFMTPIVEKTESSFAPSTISDDKEAFTSKTPSRSNRLPSSTSHNSPSGLQIDELLLNTPPQGRSSRQKRKVSVGEADLQAVTSSPQKLKLTVAGNLMISPRATAQPFAMPQPAFVKSSTHTAPSRVAPATHSKGPIIHDLQCNPVDQSIRNQILTSIHPPISSYAGFFDNAAQRCGKYPQIQAFTKKLAAAKVKTSPRKHQSERTVTQAVPPVLDFEGSSRLYAIKRELGKGAFAPVYLVDSQDLDDADVDAGVAQPTSSSNNNNNNHGHNKRSSLEAIKTEDPPSAWEFYILRLLRQRLGPMSRTMQSIILAHECHVFADECYLVLEYRHQGTLLDLVNSIKDENRKGGKADGGLDEVLAMFLSVELLRTLEECHGVGVLHGDLKADNCLVRFEGGELLEPYRRDGSLGWQAKGTTLIDFGRGIDVRAFRPEVQFVADWSAGGQDCAEVRECRPWTWQIDYFGAAGVIHSLLFGRYIETVPVAGGGAGRGLGEKTEWRLKESLKRYWAQGVWGDVFALLLNPALVAGGRGDREWKKELRRVRMGMEAWLEEEGERKGLRACIRRAEGLVNARRK
jgi:checkpoint serine/threonine-protein kinase